MVLVSVIVPNYNHGRFLKKRIESVLNQTYPYFEVIILDDSSKDNSRSVIEEYKRHPKVSQVVYNEVNSGSPFKQWKKGVSLAKGNWIWIAESDDFCENNLLENLITKVRGGDNVVLSYCQSFEVDEQSNVLGDLTWSTNHFDIKRWKADFYNDGLLEIKKYLVHQNTIPNASAVLFKKDTYLQVSKDFESMKLCGDWMLWVQLLKNGNIAFNAKPLNYFRTHAGTTRIIDNIKKKRQRIEEEYAVVVDIKNGFSNSRERDIIIRLKDIKSSYAYLFSFRDIIHFLLYPNSYISLIPFKYLIFYYLKNGAKQLLSKIK